MVRSRRPILLLTLVVWGCAPPSIDPASTGGVLLPETQGLAYLGGDSFSVSPGEEWLLYSLKPRPDSVPPPEDPATSLIETLGAYRLYDLEQGVSHPVSVPEAVRTEIDEGAYWLARGGCWVATEGGPVVALLNAYGPDLVVDPRQAPLMWRQRPRPESAPRAPCPIGEETFRPGDRIGPFQVETARGREVVLTDFGGRPVARHAVGRLMPVELVLGGLALSPGGKHLAYGVTRMFTMFFQGEQGYVVSADTPTRGPYRIASSIWALRWGKTHLYAAVGEPGARGIYRWALTEFPD